MARLTAFVDESTKKQVEEQAEKEALSVSEYTASLIKLGLRIKLMQKDETQQEEDKKKAELVEKHTEYLLKTSALLAEVFRCVYDESKVKTKAGNPDKTLVLIDEKVKDYINQYLGKKTSLD